MHCVVCSKYYLIQEGDSALMLAAKSGVDDVVKKLVDADGNLDLQNIVNLLH